MESVHLEKGYQQGPAPAYTVSDNVPPPPTYNEAINDPTEQPPTYESLYGKVKAAKTHSSGTADFFKKFFIIIIGTIGCSIFIGIVMAIPVAMIVMGAIHIHDCPAERFIPIYLVVGGSFWAFSSLISLCRRCTNHKKEIDSDEAEEQGKKTRPLDLIINVFLFAWFIAGNVWVYRTNGKYSTNPIAPNYCDETLYNFAFWLITSIYILFGSLCCCITLSGCIAMFIASP